MLLKNSEVYMNYSKLDIDHKIKVIEKDDAFFPKGLYDLTDCPQRLYVLGDENLLTTYSIAIVGTRSSSSYGNDLARKISEDLSKNSITIISGMADGIDESAHYGALKTGKTIAVVAGGFKEILKGSKIKRAISILENNGCIISEYHPDFIVRKGMFLRRNRLIAAIANSTIVIEAPIPSGALNTAHHAKRLNRTIYSVPWNLNYYKGEGCNKLLIDGAKPLINSKQILVDLNIVNNQLSFNEDALQNKIIPLEYKKYYEFINTNSPASLDDLIGFFKEEFVGNIVSSLTLMELENYIIFSDKGYIIKK